jgi:hypothetical protein
LDYGGRLGPSHADPFGQHCGSGRSPWCNPIKAAAWRAAKMAKRAPAQNRLALVGRRWLGTAVAAR